MTTTYSFSQSNTLSQNDFEAIEALQQICVEAMETAFKFELHYKMAGGEASGENASEKSEGAPFPLEYFCYCDGELVGYLGIVPFGERPELMGMVHPKHRRKGICKTLLSSALEAMKHHNYQRCLLLSDRISDSGQAFIQAMGGVYENSEYEMKRKTIKIPVTDDFDIEGLTLRLATNADADDISKQNAVYFQCAVSEVPQLLPEEEARRGMIVYLAELEGKIIGKIHLQKEQHTGWIYGLGIMPDYRGLGYGRGLLIRAVNIFRKEGLEIAALQVAVENETALSLYVLSGFETESTMDYFTVDLRA